MSAYDQDTNSQRLGSPGEVVKCLRASVAGRVIVPGDPDYEAARTVYYGGINRRPLAIIRVADAADVSQVVILARETGVELAVRSGGHSVAGYSVSEGGIVLDLADMKRLEIDAEGRTAWADAGLTAREVTAAAGEYGLAIGFGDSGSVGIGGITLGGGIGFLVRKFGMAIDNLLGAEIVTADGQILQANANAHPDLFWALRGGGGNFGVVTRFLFRLHQVGVVVGGMLVLPATPAILRALVAEAEAAPEELTLIANILPAPPLPFLPAEVHGQLVTMILPVFSGDVEAGMRAMKPFRAIATPIADQVRPIPYPAIYPPEDPNLHPTAVGRTFFLDGVTERVADVVFEHLKASTAQMAVTQVRVLGGAMARVSVDATAFAHRARRVMLSIAALYGHPDEAPAHEAWVASYADALRREGAGGAYVNFLFNEGEARVREAYPGVTWDRLVAIKRRYDPDNVFRLNQNIPPSQ